MKPRHEVRKHLERFGSISRTAAWAKWRVFDLPQVIRQIKKTRPDIIRDGKGLDLKYIIPSIAVKYGWKPKAVKVEKYVQLTLID